MPRPAHATAHAALTAAPLVLLAACGGGDSSSRPPRGAAADSAALPCPSLDEAVGVAVADFIAVAKPKPQRFLMAAGTDSALPEPGLRVLQDKGPTWFFPSNATQQQELRKTLEDRGPYATLLVVRRDAALAGRRATVRLGGHYVGGADDGRTPPARSYALTCQNGRWVLGSAADERTA